MTRIPIAIVGLNFGRHILESQFASGTTTPDFELVGVCSQEPLVTAAAASKYNCKGYTDLDQLLADKSIKAIGLFSGPVGRAALIRKIIRAEKDVMTTKPFEVDPDAARDVLEEAWGLDRVVHMNSPSPTFAPDLLQIRDWHTKYELGRPIACRADVWANYREEADGKWYDDPALCPVAPIFRLGIYSINDTIRLFGSPESVQVSSSRLFTGRPTPDNSQLTVLFKNGAIASFFASFCVNDQEPYKNTLVLNYEKGTIYRNTGPNPEDGENVVRLSVVAIKDGKRVIEKTTVTHGSGNYHWADFARAIRGETLEDQVTIDQIVDGLRVIRAMSKSEKTRSTEFA